MKRILVASLAVLLIGGVQADEKRGWESAQRYFKPISTFDVIAGNGSAVAEIVDVSKNGKTLVYTDADNESVGFVDISNPRYPKGDGTLAVGGEPTSLAIVGPWLLVAINTSDSFVTPSGKLLVFNMYSRNLMAEHDLGGQPDSVAVSPWGKYAAIVIENERDEDLGGGFIPQLPSGGLKIVNMRGSPKHWELTDADLSPVQASAFAGSDLEGEYVDINYRNQAVISFQENNHLAIVDLRTGKTKIEFSAGSVELTNVDATGKVQKIALREQFGEILVKS